MPQASRSMSQATKPSVKAIGSVVPATAASPVAKRFTTSSNTPTIVELTRVGRELKRKLVQQKYAPQIEAMYR